MKKIGFIATSAHTFHTLIYTCIRTYATFPHTFYTRVYVCKGYIRVYAKVISACICMRLLCICDIRVYMYATSAHTLYTHVCGNHVIYVCIFMQLLRVCDIHVYMYAIFVKPWPDRQPNSRNFAKFQKCLPHTKGGEKNHKRPKKFRKNWKHE